MKDKFFPAFFVLAFVCASGLSAAQAENTITGKVAAMTKNSTSSTAEIIPKALGGQAPYRYSVSTTFQEIADMLMQAMQSKATVTIVSSKNCAAEGVVRDCGSVVTIEVMQHAAPDSIYPNEASGARP